MDTILIFWTRLVILTTVICYRHAWQIEKVCRWRYNILTNIKQQNTKISELEDLVRKQKEEIDDLKQEMMKLKSLVEKVTVGVTTTSSPTSETAGKETTLDEMKKSLTEVIDTTDELTTAVNEIKQTEHYMNKTLNSIHIQDAFDCSLLSSYTGVKEIQANKQAVRVYCNRGWMSIARRFDGSVDFYRNWSDYQHGFGDPSGEYFIGLDNLAAVTGHSRYRLRIELTSWGNESHPGETKYAEYERFSVGNEADNYRLRVESYSGTAGDSLSYRDNMLFTTYDRENDLHRKLNCAEAMKGAWWYMWCAMSNLFGPYIQGGNCTSLSGECIIWYHWPEKLGSPDNHYYSFKAVDMKIYPLYPLHLQYGGIVEEIRRKQKLIEFHLKDIEGQLATYQDCSETFDFTGHLFIKTKTDKRLFRAYCNQGWLSIARRMDGSVDFFRSWSEYQAGFGSVSGEYFIGLDNLVSMLKDRRYKLRIELTTWGVEDTRFAEYSIFHVSNSSTNYSLTLDGYSGTAGDSLGVHNGTQFSTFDRDNEIIYKRNCAMTWHSGWWYSRYNNTTPMCGYANPFGLYVNGGKC
ncbi:unnamed protein product, partial [Owenia fusiformis]